MSLNGPWVRVGPRQSLAESASRNEGWRLSAKRRPRNPGPVSRVDPGYHEG